LLRGFAFTHEAVREWEERFAPLLAKHLRCQRKGRLDGAGTWTRPT
jgi:transposase-like protein